MRYLLPFLLVSLCIRGGEVWSDNLWPNSSFEEGLSGWTTDGGVDLTDGLAFHELSALRASNGGALNFRVVSPVIEQPSGWYLLSFWYRVELSGAERPSLLVYVDRHAGTGARQRRDSIYFYYGHHADPGQWQLTFLTFRLRPGDSGVGLRFAVDSHLSSLDIDLVQLRRLDPPVGEGEVTCIYTDTYGTQRVADADGANGFAEQVSAGKQTRGGKTGGSSRFDNPPGLYRITFRFRQMEPGEATVTRIRLATDSGVTIDDITVDDFAGDGEWREFSVWSLYPFGTGSFPGWEWLGTGSYRFASATYRLMRAVTHREAWELLASGVGADAAVPAGEPLPEGTTTWLGFGLYTELTGVLPALETAGRKVAVSWLVTSRGGGMSLEPRLPSLQGVKTVVLANIPLRALSPLEQLAIQAFVRGGGMLVVTGGFYAYGHGGYAGSFLEESLPVTVRGSFDLVRVEDRACSWLHDLSPREQATTVWQIEERPALVEWSFGKGRVVAVAATVLGQPEEPFWEATAWGDYLDGLLR